MRNKNPREGSTLRSLFEELGEWDEVEARVEKRVIAETLRRAMVKQNVTKSELAKRMDTSRSQVDAILNGEDVGLTLVSLSRASYALGLRPEIRFTSRAVARPATPRSKTRVARVRRPSAASGRPAG
jgi:transcriptional regulator with XRE-family HTH domain